MYYNVGLKKKKKKKGAVCFQELSPKPSENKK